MSMYLPITPVPYVRMTRRDQWKPSQQRYKQYCKDIRALGAMYREGQKAIFYLPMPKSWSAKKRALNDGKPHRHKPDLDNLFKGLMDAIFYGSEHDDCMIASISAEKYWAEQGSILIMEAAQ